MDNGILLAKQSTYSIPYLTHYSSFHFLFHYPHITPIDTLAVFRIRQVLLCRWSSFCKHVAHDKVLHDFRNEGLKGIPQHDFGFRV